jgi:hypothetical protein
MFMVTRNRIDLAANALLAEARMQRDRALDRTTRFMVWLYPALANVAPGERREVLRTTYSRAARHGSIYAIGTLVVITALLPLGAAVWKWNLRPLIGLLPVLLFIGLQAALLVRTRWLLRQK